MAAVLTHGALGELEALAQLPPAPQRLLAYADLLDRARAAVRRALAAHHLVVVASRLHAALGADHSALEALDVPVDLLALFPEWRLGSRDGFRPARSGLRLLEAGAARPLGTLRLQLSPAPGSVAYALILLRDLMQRVDSSTRLVVVVEPGADIAALERLAARLSGRAAGRVRFVHLRAITVFAQDNARATRDGAGRPVLLVPRAFRRRAERADDEMVPAEAEKAFGIPVRRSLLYWEGGNVVYDEERCLVGVDTIAENVARLGLAPDEVVEILSAEFGLRVIPFGDASASRFDPDRDRLVSSGQAAFHIDLDIALLGRYGALRRARALVADAARGLDFLDEVLACRRFYGGHFLPGRDMRRLLRGEYEAYANKRHPKLLAYAETLAALGCRVIGMPDLRIDPKENVFERVNLDFGYCNVLPGRWRGRPAVHYFGWGIPRLDREAVRRLMAAGVTPVRVSAPHVASDLMLRRGGLRCCCGSL